MASTASVTEAEVDTFVSQASFRDLSAALTLKLGPEKTVYFKVVAVVHGKWISIYDGCTQYSLNAVTAPAGGCWVCPSLMAVTEHALKLPTRSVLLDAPRIILRVAGWNEYGAAPPMPEGHPPSDTKLLVSHVIPIEAWPYEQLMLAAGRSAEPTKSLAEPTKSAGSSVSPVSITSLIDAFENAFPLLSLHLLRCAGQLAIECGRHSYDRTAWLTFHSCGAENAWAPAPVVIRVLRDASSPAAYSLDTALGDVEACLSWMTTIAGPCELLLVEPGGAFWDDAELVYAKPMPSDADGPRRVRDGASPMVALVPPASWEGESAHRIVEVPSSGTGANYSMSKQFPRLCALLAPPSPPPATQPATRSARASSASTDADRARRSVAAAAHKAVMDACVRGFTIGTALAASGAPCAELVSARRSVWAMPVEQMHSVAGALACLEMQLPSGRNELPRHALICTKLAATEQARRRSARAPRRYPSPRSIGDVQFARASS